MEDQNYQDENFSSFEKEKKESNVKVFSPSGNDESGVKEASGGEGKVKEGKKGGGKLKWFLLGLVVVFLVTGAAITRAGYIPNYLGLEFLNPPGPCDHIEEKFRDFCEQNMSDRCTVQGICVEKPVIYLYPKEKQEVKVQLDYAGDLVATYPEYSEEVGGWEVLASPDGNLVNKSDGKKYSYIFWEGKGGYEDWDLSKGFVVRGQDTVEFLQEKLDYLGLTPREYNEFIVYWYPRMKDNPYNLIYFAEKDYTEKANLKITPEPDSVLRVFMVYKPLYEMIEVEEQDLERFERRGFAVVEWGGTEVK